MQVHALQPSDHWQRASHSNAWHAPQLTPPTDVDVLPGSHSPMPVQADASPHRHASEQVRLRVPQRSQGTVSTMPAVHSPMPVQSPRGPHVQLSRQVWTRVPQRSQGISRRSPGEHSQAAHVPETQREPAAQGIVPGQHARPMAPHASHTPALHVRPTLQPSPAQQASPSRPHGRHVPARQTRIPLQAIAPSQQG